MYDLIEERSYRSYTSATHQPVMQHPPEVQLAVAIERVVRLQHEREVAHANWRGYEMRKGTGRDGLVVSAVS